MESESTRPERHHTLPERGFAVGVTIALAAAAFFTLRVRAYVHAVLDDWGLELPSHTRWALALPWGVILCVFLVPGVWLLIRDCLVSDDMVRRWGGVVVGLAFLAWLLFLVVSLTLPLATADRLLSLAAAGITSGS